MADNFISCRRAACLRHLLFLISFSCFALVIEVHPRVRKPDHTGSSLVSPSASALSIGPAIRGLHMTWITTGRRPPLIVSHCRPPPPGQQVQKRRREKESRWKLFVVIPAQHADLTVSQRQACTTNCARYTRLAETHE